jgi:hypothetical protein
MIQTIDKFKIVKLDKSVFDGYLSEQEDGIWISSITAKRIGNGDFSRLIKELREKYNWIKIPTPSNMMKERAKHLGFIEREEWFGEPFNEMGLIMFWSKNGQTRQSNLHKRIS